MYYVLGAIGALIRDNKLGYNVKVIIDGEEESGSKNTSDIFTSLKDDLVSDYLLVYDSSTTGKDEGCIELSLRGICSFKIQLTGAKTGFHSGEYGGILRNPAMELVKLLSTLQSGDGRVSVSGFYDGVEELEALPYDKILSYDAEKCLKNTGAYPTGGEQYIDNPRVRAGFRPTLDILYLSSGATFEKDVSNSIPSTATAIIIHADNESFALEQFKKGFLFTYLYFAK